MCRVPSPGLKTALALHSIGIVTLVAAGLAPAGFALLGRLAEDHARQRTELAAQGAVGAIERLCEQTAGTARLLAERPTLRALAAVGDRAALEEFLDRFRTTGGVRGCAITTAGEVVAAAPAALPWRELAEAAVGLRWIVATAPVPASSGNRTLVVVELDARLEGELGARVGLPVRIVPAAGELPSSEVAADGTIRYLAAAGELPGLAVEATCSGASIVATQAPLRRTFVIVTIAATAVAVVIGLLFARRLAGPMISLGAAADRIGGGDLATAVPRVRGAEASALAAAMDAMRLRLRTTTTELRQREAEARALLDGSAEGVFAVDSARRIVYLNPQAAGRLGVDAKDALGRFCGDVLHPALPADERPCDTACPIVHARSLGSTRAVERLRLPSGRCTVVITSAPPVDGKQVQVMRDETEIEAARRARDAVLANVSHELKTPLAAQLASIELLRDRVGDGDPALALVDSLQRSTRRLTRLIDNLLESVRIETGRETHRIVAIDPHALVDDVVQAMRPLFDQRRQSLRIDLPPDLPTIAGDASQLAQVLGNLLANANKFAPRDSEVRIGAAPTEDGVALWVEDAGRGVPDAAVESVFERFHRADQATDGMGLGLWIAKSIVVRHGGTIEVTEGALGGARFTVNLLPWSTA